MGGLLCFAYDAEIFLLIVLREQLRDRCCFLYDFREMSSPGFMRATLGSVVFGRARSA
jgi:hypothetical protein